MKFEFDPMRYVTVPAMAVVLALGLSSCSETVEPPSSTGVASASPAPEAPTSSVTAETPQTPEETSQESAEIDASSGEAKKVEITYYGAYDNDPKGSKTISDPVIHAEAGGTGTYKDPLTFASPEGPGAYAVGQVIYVPGVRKYFIKEDECAESWTAPNGCGDVSHVDLYVGNPSDDEAVVECQEALTPKGWDTIIIGPPPDLPVSRHPLWDQATGTCAA